MERRWLWLCDCTALVLARRQLGEDDARQCVKAMLLDYGERLRVRIWQPDPYRRRLEPRAHGRPDFWALHVESWLMSTVTAPPYGRIARLEVDRADFVAVLDELYPEKWGEKSGTARISAARLREFLRRPDINCLRRQDQWQKAVAYFGRDKLTEARFDGALPEKRPKGRRKMG